MPLGRHMNLGIAFQLVDDVLDYGGKAAKLGKKHRRRFPRGQDHAAGGAGVPPRATTASGAFWVNATRAGRDRRRRSIDHAIGLMTKHRALEDTLNRAQHYGAMAVDAMALFPSSPMKSALERVGGVLSGQVALASSS